MRCLTQVEMRNKMKRSGNGSDFKQEKLTSCKWTKTEGGTLSLIETEIIRLAKMDTMKC